MIQKLFKFLSGLLFSGAVYAGNNYSYEFDSIKGDSKIKLQDYKGKLILIVNSASKCGFTKQYAGLEQLWKTYSSKGLVIIGVPSNDFGHQEPGTEEEIQNFCSVNYGVTFPLTKKVVVSGADAHPFFKNIKTMLGETASPKWNFYKYLILPDGKNILWFSSMTEPLSDKFVKTIEDNLPK